MLPCRLPWEVSSIPQLIVVSSACSSYVAYTFHYSILFLPVEVFHVAVSTTTLKDIQDSRNYLIRLCTIHIMSKMTILLAAL